MAEKILLVGDNPFHGVSHFSQEHARARNQRITDPSWASEVVASAFENGADGFMFSISETTLDIIKNLRRSGINPRYYAIIPAAGDYVRLSSKLGMVGLVRYVAEQVIKSGNFTAITNGTKGLLFNDINSLLKAYLGYEKSRMNQVLNKGQKLYTLMLHELVTEMATALEMDWVIRTHIDFLTSNGIKPGFETRNFQYLINKLEKWGIDTDNIVITAPFNELGYQMSPSRKECENSLELKSGAEIIAMSILASGRIAVPKAKEYLTNTTRLNGVVIGVSSIEQARDTFSLFRGK